MDGPVYVPRDITSCQRLINGQLDVCASRYNQMPVITWNDEKESHILTYIHCCTIASTINKTDSAITVYLISTYCADG